MTALVTVEGSQASNFLHKEEEVESLSLPHSATQARMKYLLMDWVKQREQLTCLGHIIMTWLRDFWIMKGLSLTELKQYSLATLILSLRVKVIHRTVNCQNPLTRAFVSPEGLLRSVPVKPSGLFYGHRIFRKSGQTWGTTHTLENF